MQDAKNLILTPEIGLSPNERWERETPHLLDLITTHWTIGNEDVVLDYGCGIGRLAKALIDKTGCRVIGADISANMRALAASYVASERFVAVHPNMLPMFGDGCCDLALSVWVLQHCHPLDKAISNIACMTNGPLFVVNEANHRCLPVKQGWLNDGIDVKAELTKGFGDPIAEGKLDPAVVTQASSDRTFWALYRC